MSGHHNRSRPTPNADPGRSRKNLLLLGSGDPESDVRQRIDSSGVKVRKNGVLAVEVFMSASPEWFRPDHPSRAGEFDPDKIEKFNKKALEWAKDYFGPENVVAATCHLDESTPHIHAVIVPIDNTPRKKGPQLRLNARKWLGDSKKLSSMQDSFASVMSVFGLERGIKGSKAKHTTVRSFYGVLNSPTPVVPKVEVSSPPTLIRKKAKKEWAENESDKLRKKFVPIVRKLVKKAKLAELERKKRLEYQQTALELSRKLEEYKKIVAAVRDIDLEVVAQELGLTRHRYDRHKWELGPEMNISINGSKFFDHNMERGGGGAIDLVMHVMDVDFQQAVGWLADRFGISAAAGAYSAKMLTSARKKVEKISKERKPYAPPKACDENWSHVRAYLVNERKLDERIVDKLYKKGILYADVRKNAVFIGNNIAELHGTRGVKWKGVAPGSDKKNGVSFRIGTGKILVICESSIDAISYYQFNNDKDITVVSTTGVRSSLDFIKNLENYNKIVIAYDNDKAGNEAYNNLKKKYKNIEREVALGAKDWNELWIKLQDENEKYQKMQEFELKIK